MNKTQKENQEEKRQYDSRKLLRKSLEHFYPDNKIPQSGIDLDYDKYYHQAAEYKKDCRKYLEHHQLECNEDNIDKLCYILFNAYLYCKLDDGPRFDTKLIKKCIKPSYILTNAKYQRHISNTEMSFFMHFYIEDCKLNIPATLISQFKKINDNNNTSEDKFLSFVKCIIADKHPILYFLEKRIH